MANIEGNAGPNVLRGTDRNDHMDGRAGNDRLHGGAGADDLEGSGGSDRLFGGAGRDFLDGGVGNDILSGGGGHDVFEFEEARNGLDTIVDFQNGLDRIKIEFEGNETFADLTIRNDGNGNATVSWEGGFIRLLDVQASQLTAVDFIFT